MENQHETISAPQKEANDRKSRSKFQRMIQKSIRSQRVCVLASWLIATLVAFAYTATHGIPAPRVHDEFAYLLGADTFASGRISNETHPMWQHFESFHVIHQPSYNSKYQPAQPMTLAIGQLLGHPIIGSCLALGIAIGALVWAIMAWIPRRYYWVVCCFAAFHPGLHLIWGQTYWSGAVALAGGSLLIGAFGRLTKKLEVSYALIAGLGTVLLANSRPFEGVVLAASIGLALVYKLIRNVEWKTIPFMVRVIVPGLAVLAAGIGVMLFYNLSVTGHATSMPYRIHEDSYGWTPLFLWQTPGDKPEYRHAVMEKFYVRDKTDTERKFTGVGDVVSEKLPVAYAMTRFFCSELWLLAIFGIPFLLRKQKFQMAAVILIPVFIAAMATPWAWSQYFAPAAPLMLVLFFGGLIEVWRRIKSRTALRLSVCALAPVLLLIWGSTFYNFNTRISVTSWAKHRVNLLNQLNAQDGLDLVLVRYSDEHNPCDEWVYNKSNIDSAQVVWAREISDSARTKLLKHFANRKVWVVNADDETPVLLPFDTHERQIVSRHETK